MTKKEYLRQYISADKEIGRLIDELDAWENLATKITPSYSDMPKAFGEDKTQLAVENIVRLQIELNDKIDSLVNLRKEIELTINSIHNPILQNLLRLKYFDNKTWEQIAVDMNYSYRQICRLHGQALSQMILYKKMS